MEVSVSLKLNLGAGNVKWDGYTSVDLYDKEADIQADICELPFEDNSAEEIRVIHVIEHVPYNKNEQMFKEMYRILKPGGEIHIQTPDIDVVCYNILRDGITGRWRNNLVGEYYRPWDKERYDDWEMVAGAIHRNPWNEALIRQFAEAAGFRVERKHWTESGPPYQYEENLYVVLHK